MSTTVTAERHAFDPDHYLDCRQPGWEIYEDRGLVRFERPLGSTSALVYVDGDCTELLQALHPRMGRSIVAGR